MCVSVLAASPLRSFLLAFELSSVFTHISGTSYEALIFVCKINLTITQKIRELEKNRKGATVRLLLKKQFLRNLYFNDL